MAIRLNPERARGLLLFVLFLIWIWAMLAAMGCVVPDGVTIPVTGVDLSDTTASTATAPVSTRDVGGDQTNINIAGATP